MKLFDLKVRGVALQKLAEFFAIWALWSLNRIYVYFYGSELEKFQFGILTGGDSAFSFAFSGLSVSLIFNIFTLYPVITGLFMIIYLKYCNYISTYLAPILSCTISFVFVSIIIINTRIRISINLCVMICIMIAFIYATSFWFYPKTRNYGD